MRFLEAIGAAAVILVIAGCVVLAVAFGLDRIRAHHAPAIALKAGLFPDGRPIAVRALPASFPPDTNLPPLKEVLVCGSVEGKDFSPARDLVFVDDPRVWWESDRDVSDDEDDHSVHRDLELPLRRLIELVSSQGGTLRVHDSYRPQSVHKSTSLHKEGRAIDLTCDELGLEPLAGLHSTGARQEVRPRRGSGWPFPAFALFAWFTTRASAYLSGGGFGSPSMHAIELKRSLSGRE
jgi:hypothetical protein